MFDKIAVKVVNFLFRKSSPMAFKELCEFDKNGRLVFSNDISTDKLIGIICTLLGKSSLTLEQRNELTVQILDTLEALPITEVFSISENGELLIRGVAVDYDKALKLREYANSALDNQLLNLIIEQVNYQAVVGGIHKCTTPEDLYFYRAALWYGQQIMKHLKSIAVRE